MLKVQELKELIRALDQSSVDELKIEQDGAKLLLRKNQTTTVVAEKSVKSSEVLPSPTEQPESPKATLEVVSTPSKEESKPEDKPAAENVHTIKSPMVGTFYAAPSPDADPYVNKGDQVKEVSIVCIVEAMKLMNEIEAEVNGKIIEVLAEDGELVEYGQPLFVVELT